MTLICLLGGGGGTDTVRLILACSVFDAADGTVVVFAFFTNLGSCEVNPTLVVAVASGVAALSV